MTFDTLSKKNNFDIPDKYGCIYYKLVRYSNITGKVTKTYYKSRGYAQKKAMNRFYNADVRGFDISGICIYLKEYPKCH